MNCYFIKNIGYNLIKFLNESVFRWVQLIIKTSASALHQLLLIMLNNVFDFSNDLFQLLFILGFIRYNFPFLFTIIADLEKIASDMLDIFNTSGTSFRFGRPIFECIQQNLETFFTSPYFVINFEQIDS